MCHEVDDHTHTQSDVVSVHYVSMHINSQAIHGGCPRPAPDVTGFVRSLGYVGSYIKEFEADSALLEELAAGTLRNAPLVSITELYLLTYLC
jgi:hypothetical protein